MKVVSYFTDCTRSTDGVRRLAFCKGSAFKLDNFQYFLECCFFKAATCLLFLAVCPGLAHQSNCMVTSHFILTPRDVSQSREEWQSYTLLCKCPVLGTFECSDGGGEGRGGGVMGTTYVNGIIQHLVSVYLQCAYCTQGIPYFRGGGRS